VLRLLSVWIRSGFERSGMADTYVFFDCCGSCLFVLCLSILPLVPQHVFVPVLRARRLPLPAGAFSKQCRSKSDSLLEDIL
jgi:hypothetical protein